METTTISIPLAEYEALLRVLIAAISSLGNGKFVDIRDSLCNEELSFTSYRACAIREYDKRVT